MFLLLCLQRSQRSEIRAPFLNGAYKWCMHACTHNPAGDGPALGQILGVFDRLAPGTGITMRPMLRDSEHGDPTRPLTLDAWTM